MTLHATPTLLNLAVQSLLKDETLAISALEDLPGDIFPPLFKEAITGRQSKVLRAMVAAWPFPCLPLGSLMKTDDLETLKAALHGLDDLLTMEVNPRDFSLCDPRRCKLQVLDLRNVPQNFWNVGTGVVDGGCSPQGTSQKPALKEHPGSVKTPLKVFIDLCLKSQSLEEYQTYLFPWAQQRKGHVHLCCKKMEIWPLSTYPLLEFLDVVQLDSVEDLKMKSFWKLRNLAGPPPYITKRRNYRELIFPRAQIPVSWLEMPCSIWESSSVSKFISHLPTFSCLRHLCVNNVQFVGDRLKQMVRSVKTPLETLQITHYQLPQSDLDCLSQCPSVGQLKHLNLSGVILFFLSLESFQVLLDRVSSTLQVLELEGCEMLDSHITSFQPALSRCSQLTRVNLCDNSLSMPILKDLLQHTASLSQLTMELYPAPLESYDEDGCLWKERFVQNCLELMDSLRAIRQPKTVSFATPVCHLCKKRCVYNQGVTLCRCGEV